MAADRRVLVTGATGFVGRHTLAPLHERGFDVHAVTSRAVPGADVPVAGAGPGAPAAAGDVTWHRADLLDPAARRAVVADAGCSHLLHLAWYAEPGAFWDARENAAWVAATIDLVDAFAGAGGRRAVLAGTCAEYDWTAIGGPLREDAAIAPATYYGCCKHAAHEVASGLAERSGVELVWGRIFFLYGPGEDERRLVAGVARALLAGERAPTSAGSQRRDFLHVADAGAAFAALVAAELTGPVNVGSGAGLAVRDIVTTVARAADAEDRLDIGALPTRDGDPEAIVADVARLRDEARFTPGRELVEGLRETVAWWAEGRA